MTDERAYVNVVSETGRSSLLAMLNLTGVDPVVWYVVSGADVESEVDFFRVCYEAFFGEVTYGHNWDAFDDVCGDVVFGDPSAGRKFDWEVPNHVTIVLFTDLDAFFVRHPNCWQMAAEIARRASQNAVDSHGVGLYWIITASVPHQVVLSRTTEQVKGE